MELRSDFLHLIHSRGFIHQSTPLEALDSLLLGYRPATAYIGFDVTADSLHVGSLVPIMLLYWWQQMGHRPLVLLGGGTTQIGDPSGKDQSRQLLSQENIAYNLQGIARVFQKVLLTNGGPNSALFVNNQDWLQNLPYIPFLRDIGQHFSVNRMLSFDNVRLRLEREQHLSFLEFNYMVLQAYDFLHLYSHHQCILQMGGSDQWGNILNGVDLVRKIHGQHVFGLTTPLITTASGEKMGKTAQGAVWLNEDKLHPNDYWQLWRNTDDRDVPRYLRLFTTLPLQEIEKLERLQGQEINEAKKILADEATAFLHGREAAHRARQEAENIFEQAFLNDVASHIIQASFLEEAPQLLVDMLNSYGLASSKSEARRLIKGHGVRINDHAVEDEGSMITLEYFLPHGQARILKITVGKKRHCILKLE